MEKGNLSIHSENILPIIKKWLYSDVDIFARELVSNAVDAITKLKKLVQMGEAANTTDEYAVHVIVDKEKKQIIFEDNGIGMTSDEVREYITQIAFSGATAFMENYKEKGETAGEIIGHFGLGFYSSFMVSDKVQIDTVSYKPGEPATKWECEGGIEYSIGESDRVERGTKITLFVSEDGEEFLDIYKLRAILTKYCGFVSVPVFVEEIKPEPAETEATSKEGSEETDNVAPSAINDTNPLWLKSANECTDDEYKAFYRKVFSDFNEPLFWIHLNMDYPFRLKGILYFPKLKNDIEYMEGQVKLFNNQVFVAENIKEVIPEYLLLLKGVMDCPDLPLNVSRSFLQNDATVKKMSGYISRKVADKLNGLFKKSRDSYNSYWDDIAPFIKYGCIKEQDFYTKIKGSILYKTISDKYLTLEEFLAENEEKTAKTVYYVTNTQLQAQYVQLFKSQELDAVCLHTNLDAPFISYLESYEPDVKFNRIDADISDALKDETEVEATPEEFQEQLRNSIGNQKLLVKIESLKSDDVSAVILLSEQSRRMQEMSKMFGGGPLPAGMFEEELTLVLNRNHKLVQTLLEYHNDTARESDISLIAQHLYDLAMLTHKPLPAEQMANFVSRSNYILGKALS